ncbi:MAG: imidazoleglycerol-phosphate dehydratase HisB [Planctomycetota bacterium]
MGTQKNTSQGYSPPQFTGEIQLQLSRNESTPALDDLPSRAESLLNNETVCRYPDRSRLRNTIAEFVGVDSNRIVITAGGDDAIDRVMNAFISEESNRVVGHSPSFEMIDIYADQYSVRLNKINWPEGDFPADEFKQQITPDTCLAVIVTPNNPTGGVVPTAQIVDIAARAKEQNAMLLLDNAYVEFADEDPTRALTDLSNVLIVRTFSKAWGLAGLRIGYLIAPDKETADLIRAVPGPYPVSGLSIAIAGRAMADCEATMRRNVEQIRKIRSLVTCLIDSAGGKPLQSGGNFVLGEFEDAPGIWSGLSSQGVGVRIFPDSKELAGKLRITVPHSVAGFLELVSALSRVTGLDPEPHKQAAGGLVFSEFELEAPPVDVAGSRKATINRKTKETEIEIDLNLDGTGQTEIETGIGFLDHMLTALAFHSRIDLRLRCKGDIEVDDHHTAEDCALALGAAIDSALGRRSGIKRFGYAYAPLDEALARTVIDLSGRPWPEINLQLQREMIGQWACENIVHFFQSLAMSLKCSLHVDVVRGSNDHHRAEAAFKSLAKALGQAITKTDGEVPSTKGVL